MVKRARDTESTSWYLSPFKYNCYNQPDRKQESRDTCIYSGPLHLQITLVCSHHQHNIRRGDILQNYILYSRILYEGRIDSRIVYEIQAIFPQFPPT